MTAVMTWTEGVEFEAQARQQVENTASLPFVTPHVAVMPDVHAGIGSTVGTVVPTMGAIIPACVGVDIGCGMMAIELPLTASMLPDNLHEWRSKIEAAVPVGNAMHADESMAPLDPRIIGSHDELGGISDYVDWRRVHRQVGTLGGGNHFIELCLDEHSKVWLVVHSGSRGVGNQIGTHYIELAKREMERWFIHLPDKDLAYLPEGSQYFDAYMKAMLWAQRYATTNREGIVMLTLRALGLPNTMYETKAISCHHNYVSIERHFGQRLYVTRKGAVSAQLGELGIIPGSMGARSYIVRGKGNRDSLCSCSHGAGRRMSRRQARDTISEEAFRLQVEGVECRTDSSVLDEAPAAYKDIDAVMEAQKDLVEVVHTLKQVLCVKG